MPPHLARGLEQAGLEQERRALRLAVVGLECEWPVANELVIAFELGGRCVRDRGIAGSVRLAGRGIGRRAPQWQQVTHLRSRQRLAIGARPGNSHTAPVQ